MNTKKHGQTEKSKQESKRLKSSESQGDNYPSSDEFKKHYHVVEDTPFTLIYHNEQYHICLGQNIVGAKPFKSIPEAEEYINQKPWQLMLVAGYIYGKMVEAKIKENKEMQMKKGK